MLNVGTLVAMLTLRNQMGPELKKATGDLQAAGRTMTRVGAGLTAAVTLPLAGIGAASLAMAVDAEEAASKFDVVMGPAAARLRGEFQQLHDVMPLTTSEMEAATAGIQDMLVPMGIARGSAADMSLEMLKLSGDISSFNNVAQAQVLDDFKSALAGQSEPMRKYGIDTRITTLEVVALEAGLIEAGQAMDQTTMAQAVLLQATKQSADAIGDQERTVMSAANQLKLMWRDVRDLGLEIGQALIPVVKALVPPIRGMVQWFTELGPVSQTVLMVLGGIAAAAGPVLIVAGQMVTAFASLSGVLGGAGAATGLAGALSSVVAFLAGPVGIAIAAGAVLLAWEPFRNLVGTIGGLLMELARGALSLVVSGLRAMWEIASPLVDIVTGLAGAVGEILGDALLWAVEQLANFTQGLKDMREGAAAFESAEAAASRLAAQAEGLNRVWERFGEEGLASWIKNADLTDEKVRELMGGLSILQERGDISRETMMLLAAALKATNEPAAGAAENVAKTTLELTKFPGTADAATRAMWALANSARAAAGEFEDTEGVIAEFTVGPPANVPPLIDSITRSMERYGITVPNVNRELTALRNLWESGQVPAKQMAEVLRQKHDEFERLGVLTPEVAAELKALGRETGVTTGDLGDFFGQIKTGIPVVDGFLGKLKGFFGIFKSIAGALANVGGKMGDFFGKLGGLGGGSGGSGFGFGGIVDSVKGIFSGGGGQQVVKAWGSDVGQIAGQSFFTAGAEGATGFLGGLKGILGSVSSFMPIVGPLLAAFGGPLLKGVKALGGKIAGVFKRLFGGPSADELDARKIVDAFKDGTAAVLDAAQAAELAAAGGERWQAVNILVRDSYLALGKSEAEALAAVEAINKASHESGPAAEAAVSAVQKVIEEARKAAEEAGQTLTEFRNGVMSGVGEAAGATADAIAEAEAGYKGALENIEQAQKALTLATGEEDKRRAEMMMFEAQRAAAEWKKELDKIKDESKTTGQQVIDNLARVAEHVPMIEIPVGFSVGNRANSPDDFDIPVMHSGGVVPGRPGSDVPIIAQAGETIIPRGGSVGSDKEVLRELRSLRSDLKTVLPAAINHAVQTR